jgi:hypothetical protein
VYVYVYVYVCVCVCICMYIYICICNYIYINTYTHIMKGVCMGGNILVVRKAICGWYTGLVAIFRTHSTRGAHRSFWSTSAMWVTLHVLQAQWPKPKACGTKRHMVSFLATQIKYTYCIMHICTHMCVNVCITHTGTYMLTHTNYPTMWHQNRCVILLLIVMALWSIHMMFAYIPIIGIIS